MNKEEQEFYWRQEQIARQEAERAAQEAAHQRAMEEMARRRNEK